MITLVTGGSGSGKSEYAEQLVLAAGRPRQYYVATMEAYGREGREKVARHRRLRQGKGFITLERRRKVGDPLGPEEKLQPEATAVLLECVSNLAANVMFGPEGASEKETDLDLLADEIIADISRLALQAGDTVIVTNQVGDDGGGYEPETENYIRLMGRINAGLIQMCGTVVEVVYGIPVMWKGESL